MPPSSPDGITPWDFGPAISLLQTLSPQPRIGSPPPRTIPLTYSPASQGLIQPDLSLIDGRRLGDFERVWDFLAAADADDSKPRDGSAGRDIEYATKEVRWRDQVSGADLQEHVDVEPAASAGSEATRKRALRRLRARERRQLTTSPSTSLPPLATESDTGNESGLELVGRLRSSPDRRAVIRSILYPQPKAAALDPPSPPTSPSPPRPSAFRARKEPPLSNPFYWPTTATSTLSYKQRIRPRDHLSREQGTTRLVGRLRQQFSQDSKYLRNAGIVYPECLALNTSELGIHVFVDISNITIGFHDCLKRSRDIPTSTRIRRVPMSFHHFTLIIERARPAAKRVVVGSDHFPVIEQAKRIGYETNILERVSKPRPTAVRSPRRGRDDPPSGLSSGSESPLTKRPERWVEQAVDEILHLKILESVVDAAEPSKIVLATGDAKEAEYSGGFLKMIERALLKGWQVEVVSFKSNTSGAYRRKEFRSRWGSMFQWLQLDDFVEDLIDNEGDS